MSDTFDLDKVIRQMEQETHADQKRKTIYGEPAISDELREQLMLLCQSKAEEFALLGYDKVKKEEIWRYFESRYRKEFPPVHQIANEILSLKVTQFMNWATINAYKGL